MFYLNLSNWLFPVRNTIRWAAQPVWGFIHDWTCTVRGKGPRIPSGTIYMCKLWTRNENKIGATLHIDSKPANIIEPSNHKLATPLTWFSHRHNRYEKLHNSAYHIPEQAIQIGKHNVDAIIKGKQASMPCNRGSIFIYYLIIIPHEKYNLVRH